MIAQQATARLQLFGRNAKITVADESGNQQQLLALASRELKRIEDKLSYHYPTSVIYRINQLAGSDTKTAIDSETRHLLKLSLALWRQSNGIFDLSIRPLTDLYKDSKLPAMASVAKVSHLANWEALQIDDDGALLPHKGMRIDLNTLARPYALDCARKTLLGANVTNACIDLDKDRCTIGTQADGANWLAGVRYPRQGETAIGRFKVNNSGFAIRGSFENLIAYEGEVFGRAISPIDGLPVPGPLVVAVVADDCITASSAANAARYKTEQAALSWLHSIDLQWLAIDRQLHCHGPLAAHFNGL